MHTTPTPKDTFTPSAPSVHLVTLSDAERADAYRQAFRSLAAVLHNTLAYLDEGRACGFSAKAVLIDTDLLRHAPDRIAAAHHVEL